MGGIDISDQISSAHSNEHKPNGLFWRRKIDSMEQVSITNSFLLRGMWAKFTKDKIDKELERMGPETHSPEKESICDGQLFHGIDFPSPE